MERPSPTLFREPFEPPRQATAAVRLLFLYQIDQLVRHARSGRYEEPVTSQLAAFCDQLKEIRKLIAAPEPPDPVRFAKTCANAANYLAFFLVRALSEISARGPRHPETGL
jgi:hypothetical protein